MAFHITALALTERLVGSQGLVLIAVVIGVCVPTLNAGAVWPMARHGQRGIVAERRAAARQTTMAAPHHAATGDTRMTRLIAAVRSVRLAAAMAASIAAAAALGACASAGSGSSMASPAPVDPATAGWKVAAQQDAVDYAQGQRTTGLLIIHNRRIVAEYNWPLPSDTATANFKAAFVHGQAPGGALLEDVASQQKSFVAILVGVAVDQGLMDIDKPVSTYAGAGWSKAAPATEARTSVRHLLEMTSGLKEDLTSEAEPGTRFF